LIIAAKNYFRGSHPAASFFAEDFGNLQEAEESGMLQSGHFFRKRLNGKNIF
jgi:hypothetical protein